MCNVCNSCGNCNGWSNTGENNGGCCSQCRARQRMCRDCNGNIRLLNNECGCCFCGNTCFGSCVRMTTTTNDTITFDEYYARQYALNGGNNRTACDCGCNGGRNGCWSNRCGCGCG